MKATLRTIKASVSVAAIAASLLILQIVSPLNNSNNLNVFAASTTTKASDQPVSQKLSYAHFMPLTNNSKLHQVKVIVDYNVRSASTINPNQNAIMKIYALNGTLVKTSSFPNGLKISPIGQAQLATTIPDSNMRNATAFVMFTDASKIANFSNPLNVKLNLGQTIPPS